jgi:AraC-like DNA-binding protein
MRSRSDVRQDIPSGLGPDLLGGLGARWLTALEEAQVHRDAYIAILESHLRGRGSKSMLAQRVGVSIQYLSYLLDPDNHRTPARKALQIAHALQLPTELEATVVHHMTLSQAARITARGHLKGAIRHGAAAAMVQSLRHLHGLAMTTQDPVEARGCYRHAREAAVQFLVGTTPADGCNEYLETCFVLHDALCVLDRPDQAFYVARVARAVADRLSGSAGTEHRVHALRAEGVALHNLGLDGQARDRQAAARQVARDGRVPAETWMPQSARDVLIALAGVRRPTIAEAEAIAASARRVLHRMPDEGLAVLSARVDEALGQFLVRHGGSRALVRARSVLMPLVDSLDHIPGLGALLQVSTLRTAAELRYRLGDYDHWVVLLDQAYDSARSAGLAHQLGCIVSDSADRRRLLQARTRHAELMDAMP